ncbi:hypothetical protein [Kordiimonas sp.]|uniref:hypothetical protein n=1 Tax=Kordiimonas sp. TaxID=1970157 RepID=UPI003B521BE0
MTGATFLFAQLLTFVCIFYAGWTLLLSRGERRAAAAEQEKASAEREEIEAVMVQIAALRTEFAKATAHADQATKHSVALKEVVLNEQHERQETTRALRALIRELRFVRSQGTCPLLKKEKDDDSLVGPPQVGLAPTPLRSNHDNDTDPSPSDDW